MTNYEMLKPNEQTKKEGNFVQDLQGQTGVGFQANTHVHKDWWATTHSYDEGLEMLESQRSKREDILAARQTLSPAVNSEGKFVLRYQDGRQFTPTEHALNQFGVHTYTSTFFLNSLLENPVKPNGSLRFRRDKQDAETLVNVCDNALRRIDNSKVFRLRTYDDGTLRAFLTEKYAPIDNRWYLELLKSILPEGRLSHWRGDADTIFGNILLPDTVIDYGQDDDTDYGGMLSIGNCEIGKRRISQCPSIFRAICLNGCIWGETKGKNISQVHRGKLDLTMLQKRIKDNIEKQLPLLPQGIQRLLGTRIHGSDGVAMKGIIAAVCSDHKMSKKESAEVLTQWVKNERSHRNLFGVINAVTRAGQTLNNDSWVKFDHLGGQLLNYETNRWDLIKKRAESYSDTDLEKIFI